MPAAVRATPTDPPPSVQILALPISISIPISIPAPIRLASTPAAA